MKLPFDGVKRYCASTPGPPRDGFTVAKRLKHETLYYGFRQDAVEEINASKMFLFQIQPIMINDDNFLHQINHD